MTYLPRVVSIDNISDISEEMRKIKAHGAGVDIMAPKGVFRVIKIKDITVTAANIIKQNMLSRGGDAATSNDTIVHKAEKTDVILMGTLAQYEDLFDRLASQQFKLPLIAEEIKKVLKNQDSVPSPVKGLEFGKKTHLMGILNTTPDSFSDGGKYSSSEKAVEHAMNMIDNGASIIDIGGESTRPGADPVDDDIEISRVIPVIEAVRAWRRRAPSNDELPLISIDTRKSKVAEAAIKAGAKIVNDISGLRYDSKMAVICAENDVAVIIMHSKGDPKTMQEDPLYDDIISEMLGFFEDSINIADKAGITRNNIIIDPGIGFGKKLEHNIEILKRLEEFRCFGLPVCLGASRKSFLGAILGEKDPGMRDVATSAVSALAICKKVDIIRIHDIDITYQISIVLDKILKKGD